MKLKSPDEHRTARVVPLQINGSEPDANAFRLITELWGQVNGAERFNFLGRERISRERVRPFEVVRWHLLVCRSSHSRLPDKTRRRSDGRNTKMSSPPTDLVERSNGS
jgi:hypothetical protein